MSNATFTQQWKETMADLADQLDSEAGAETEISLRGAESVVTRAIEEAFQKQGLNYVKYIQIYRKLEDIYDQMAHPQKRRDIRVVLEAVIGRILELHDVLVKQQQTDFVSLDDILLDLKLPPDALDLPVPRFYVDDRSQDLEEREKMLTALVEQHHGAKDGSGADGDGDEPPMTLEEAVQIIQANERGKQGRQRARLLREIKQRELKQRRALEYGEEDADLEAAAVTIQRIYRGFAARQAVTELRDQEAEFIGMAPAPKGPESNPLSKLQSTHKYRKNLQIQNEQEYQQALVTIKQKLHENEAPDLKEQMTEEIQSWYMSYREEHGKFPDYPTIEQGGSLMIRNPPAVVMEEEGDKGKKSAAGKGGKSTAPPKSAGSVPPKSAGSDGKGGKGKGGKSKGKDDAAPQKITIPESNHTKFIKDGVSQFSNMWRDRDESGNFVQKFDAELVKDMLRPDVEEEVRLEVDAMLRIELEQLKAMMENKKAKKGL
eukprot:TRINITY_DN5325_c0_g1_i5.p1 TRINITY_DN5325_c0_g1~~TRINITY_DN5325_c0_g1_i5.p1  ORF type:complete len:488 (-),score=127.89 TRINITY_DN5325_c0_g1_i5:1424-2887(-)